MPKTKPPLLHQPGFTIVELITVIVLLGILSAVAIPRFLNITSEANLAVLEAMEGAVFSAANLVYGKARLQGVHKQLSATVDIDGDGAGDLEVRYGYPSGSRNNGISKIMGGSFESEWTWSTSYGDGRFYLTTAALGGRSGVYVNQTAVVNSGCYLIYVPAASAGALPTMSYVTTSC